MHTPEVERVEETGGIAVDLHSPTFGREGTLNRFVSKSSVWGCRLAVGCVFSIIFSSQTTFPKRHLPVFCKLPRQLTSSGGLDMGGVANSRVSSFEGGMVVFVEITDRDPYTCSLTALGCPHHSTCLRYCFKDKGRLLYLSCSSLETVEIYFIWLWQDDHLPYMQAQAQNPASDESLLVLDGPKKTGVKVEHAFVKW